MIVRTRNCDSCSKLSTEKRLTKYKPRKGKQTILLCDKCYQSFVAIDEVIQTLFSDKDKEKREK